MNSVVKSASHLPPPPQWTKTSPVTEFISTEGRLHTAGVRRGGPRGSCQGWQALTASNRTSPFWIGEDIS